MVDYNGFRDEVQHELSELQSMRTKLMESLRDVPDGSLNVRHKKVNEYYHYLSRTRQVYIARENINLAAVLAQKDYNSRLLRLINARIQSCQDLIHCYNRGITDVYEALDPARRSLLSQHILTDEEFVRDWYEKHPGGQNTYPINTEYYSVRGEHMRSKSEKILADLFERCNIPYVYEPRITLTNGNSVCPDFLLLDLRRRQTIIFEHFGMMDDSEYSEKTCRKIQLYSMNDILPGENFLFSVESRQNPLNERSVEKMLRRVFPAKYIHYRSNQ